LLAFIREQAAAGHSVDRIRGRLLGDGVPFEEVEEALEAALAPPKPKVLWLPLAVGVATLLGTILSIVGGRRH
ncbi:MAG: hypothetical protein FD126_3697, partial [Elusimicrobia bacterium]